MKTIYLLSGPGTIGGFSNVVSSKLQKDLKDVKINHLSLLHLGVMRKI